jgi:F-type H+-transporting ATPase subunit epsilon
VARKTYQLDIVTPEKTVYGGEVCSATLPGDGGYLGVWANHAPMVAALVPGSLTLHEGASEVPTALYAVGGGFAEVSENKMVLLVDNAEQAAEIDTSRAEQALERAKEMLAKALAGDDEIDAERARRAKERAEARIHVAYLRGK